MARQGISGVLAGIAVALVLVSVGTWWASLLTVRVAGTLSAQAKTSAASQIIGQLTHSLDTGAAGTAAGTAAGLGGGQVSQWESEINQVLSDPRVSQGLATSPVSGSKELSRQLTKLDQPLGTLLNTQGVLVNAGEHSLAQTSKILKKWSGQALWAAIALGIAALILSPFRLRTIRKVTVSLVLIGLIILGFNWALPKILKSFLHGSVLQNLSYIVAGGHPVVRVGEEMFVGAILVGMGSLVFELVGGHKVSTSPENSQVPRSWTA